MSYSMIFETKIVKLSDGRIIHFDRSGCNNDYSGRQKDDFSGTIYSVDAFMNKIEKLKRNSKPIKECDPHDWELKINGRYATGYDYGEHLLRMFNRALTYEELINTMCFRVEYLTGIELSKPEHKIMTVEEFDKIYYDLLHKGYGLTYRRLIEYPDIKNEKHIVQLIEEGKPCSFEIKKWH